MATENLQTRTASLGFFDYHHEKYITEKPYACLIPLTHAPKAFEQTNITGSNHNVGVIDIRGAEEQFKLDVNGFELARHDTSFQGWYDGKRVVSEYYPHIGQLLKQVTGADAVHVYDHTIRLGDHVDTAQRKLQVQGRPSTMAHVDLTIRCAREQIKDDFGPKAEEILQNRFQVINVWHPIKEPVEQHPLSLCDARTCQEDAFPSDLVYPHVTSENYLIRYSEEQRWHFIDNQRINEAWVFKIVDSHTGYNSRIAGFAPHTSFVAPWAPADAKPRESIEFRTYVFYGTKDAVKRVSYNSV